VALAVRSECPIYIKSEILEIVGTEVELPEVEETKESTQVDIDNISSEDLNDLPLDVLEELLKTAVAEEKYELAVSIRDAIERKK